MDRCVWAGQCCREFTQSPGPIVSMPSRDHVSATSLQKAQTKSSLLVTVIAFLGLLVGTVLIFSYEYRNQPEQLVFIVTLYAILSVGSWFFSRKQHRRHPS